MKTFSSKSILRPGMIVLVLGLWTFFSANAHAGPDLPGVTGSSLEQLRAVAWSTLQQHFVEPPMVVATASNTGPYCEGATIQLQGGPAGQVSYAWSGPGGYSVQPVTQTITQNFNILINTGSGTWTDNSTVPGWYSQRSGTGVSITASTGTSTTGDLYSYGIAIGNTERALGTIGSGNAAAGNFAHGYLYHNTTGQTVTKILVSYTMEQWRNSAAAAQTLSFYYKTSNAPITALQPNSNATWTLVSALSAASPITGGTAGPLDGNQAANQVVFTSVSIGSINLVNGDYIMLKWDDPDHTGTDHGLSIDDVTISFSTAGVQNPTRPNSTVAMAGIYTITVTDAANTTSTATTNVVVNPALVATAGSYGPVCATAANITLSGTPSGGTWSGPGVVNGNQFDPSAGTQTITYTVTSGGCTDSDNTTITVNPCYTPPEMRMILLNDNGQVNGTCVSTSDCDLNRICFALQYTPNVSGTLTSYTTGFTMPCINGGDPVLANASCIMTNNSLFQNACSQIGQVLWNFSGNSGAAPQSTVTAGVPKVIHQVCFVIPNSGSISLDPFPPLPENAITTSIDAAGGPVSETPSFVPFSFDSSLYCGILPVKLLEFVAVRYDELQSKLEWVTAEEINNAYFDIQRSNDNGITFTTIGRVNAAEHPRSFNAYQFIDEVARPGVNYYRLKQVDLDGKFAYSPLRNVTFTSKSFEVKSWPNPVSDLLNIYVGHAEVNGQFELVDMAGHLVATRPFEKGDTSHELDVTAMIPGVYSLIVQCGTDRHVEKIVIMR